MTLRTLALLALGVFVAFFLLTLLKWGSYTHDEIGFHYPNVQNFYDHGFDAAFNAKYSAANTPLPYVIVAAVERITAPSLLVARLVTMLFSFFTFIAFLRILQTHGAPLSLSLAFLFYPYFFLYSFVFYVPNFGLFFALLSLLFLGSAGTRPTYRQDFFFGLSAAMATLCQQFYLVLPVGLIIARLFQGMKNRAPSRAEGIKHALVSAVAVLTPLILPLLLFAAWGGLTHPNFRHHTLAFYPSTVVGILFVTGAFFFPLLLQTYRRFTLPQITVSVLLAIGAVLMFRPIFSDLQGPGLFTGLTHHLIDMTGRVQYVFPILVMIALMTCGILVLWELVRSASNEWEYALLAMCALLGIAYAANAVIGERHLLGYVTFLFLLVLPRLRKSEALWYQVGMGVLGVSYFVYWLFFKFAAP